MPRKVDKVVDACVDCPFYRHPRAKRWECREFDLTLDGPMFDDIDERCKLPHAEESDGRTDKET